MAEVFVAAPDLPPPPSTTGAIGWLRENLFKGWFNSTLTLLAMAFLAYAVPPLVSWFLIDATFVGDAETCRAAGGACWSFIGAEFKLFMVGTYPNDATWRALLSGAMLVTLFVVTARHMLSPLVAAALWLLLPIPVYWLLGGGLGLEPVEESRWGGLMLTLLLAVIGVVVSVPLGVLLALGRRSRFIAIKSLSIGIIELVRGVPMITILFMATIMLPFFLPEGVELGVLHRVQIGIIIFSSAYMAEVVRGGLQGVDRSQIEAAAALGLRGWHTTVFIVLPQALRDVLPPLIGRCIALLKDTSLVIIVGLLDFLGIAKAASQDPAWLGFDAEAFVFCAAIYWALCFSLSRYGRSLERRGHGAFRD
ncbi:MAG: amino acid ABC transporter permease [Rhodospirillales bacterium]|nr:amino acid ABC transporter permease [Rhodospirillales bacterium]